MKNKILIILGTRPEIIKLSSFIKKSQKFFKNILVNTNQNYDKNLNKIFFDDLGIKQPKYLLKPNQSYSTNEKIAFFISSIEKILIKEKPDAVVYLGDTNTCYSLIPVKKYKIPIFHLEAGNRCYDERVPEEINRRFTDHISDINLVYSDHSRHNLIKEGIINYNIIKTGSPMFEVITDNNVKINNSTILQKLRLLNKKYILVSFHREENLDNYNIFQYFDGFLKKLIKKYKVKILISTHPRLLVKLNNRVNKNNNIIFCKPFCFSDYIMLQKNSLINLSDSGTLMEETSILKSKSILLRERHERPEGIDKGVLITSKINSEDIFDKIDFALNNENNFDIPEAYKGKNFSEIVIKTIYSYKDYVNSFIWKKV
tara:strand:+ start:517 stop:1632 length:1116 start_codon:yes stop_codon:yes gene_type:complete